MLNWNQIDLSFKNFHGLEPFNYCIVDNFFETKIAVKLSNEFLNFNNKAWHTYNNGLECKKSCNDWNQFPELTYSVFHLINSKKFVGYLKDKAQIDKLYSDAGLHGGGWHICSNAGKLNPHLDYSTHPKLKLARKLNLIIYLEREWEEGWGGHFGLYKETVKNKSKILCQEIAPTFNRAIIFDSSQNSWHGISREVKAPEGFYRKSIATYYLTELNKSHNPRKRALFAPTKQQENNKKIIEAIENRVNDQTYKDSYIT